MTEEEKGDGVPEQNEGDDAVKEAQKVFEESRAAGEKKKRAFPVELPFDVADFLMKECRMKYESGIALEKVGTKPNKDEQILAQLLYESFNESIDKATKTTPEPAEVPVPLFESEMDFINTMLLESIQTTRDIGKDEQLREVVEDMPYSRPLSDVTLERVSHLYRAFQEVNTGFVKGGGEERPAFTNFKNPPPNR